MLGSCSLATTLAGVCVLSFVFASGTPAAQHKLASRVDEKAEAFGIPGQAFRKPDVAVARHPSMAAKCEAARWLFIDETEAAGAENFGILEQHTAEAARKRLYNYRGGCETPLGLRPFGGLNLCLFGGQWQLPLVLQTSICSNPFRETRNHHARKMMSFFWGQDPLNGLTEKPF